jgi:glycosyltransferase involved in cell wall biosynthesis
MNRADTAVVIPCFNEEQTIESVVQGARAKVTVVIVVDDGSTDATASRAARAGAQVIQHACNQGKGAALRTGLERALVLHFTWALTMDGDGQHASSDIPQFFHFAETTGASMVIGSRMHESAHMPWLRRQVNRWMSRRLSRLAGRELPDTQCGFRLIQLEAWSRLSLRAQRFEVESEYLMAFLEAGLKVEFVPIQVIYKSGQSKISPVRDTLRWFRWLRTRSQSK